MLLFFCTTLTKKELSLHNVQKRREGPSVEISTENYQKTKLSPYMKHHLTVTKKSV